MGLFNLDLIKTAFFKEDNYNKGLNILDTGDITITDVKVDRFTDEKIISATIIDANNDENTTTIAIKSKEGGYTLASERSCSCSEYTKNKENCSHMATLINYLQGYKFDELELDKLNSHDSDEELLDLIEEYKKALVSRVNNNICSLIPVVKFNDTKVLVSFKISRKYAPMYDIPDLLTFVETAKNRTMYHHTINSDIEHNLALLSKNSLELVDIIESNTNCIKDNRYLELTPNEFFLLFDLEQQMFLDYNNELFKNIEFNKMSIPYSLSARESSAGLVKLRLIHPPYNLIVCDNCYIYVNGSEINYFLNKDQYLEQLIKMLSTKQMQLTISDYLKFKIFIASSLEEEIMIDEVIEFDVAKEGIEEIKVILDYQDGEIVVEIKDLDLLANTDFSRNIDYLKLIKIYHLLDDISFRDGNRLHIKNVRDIYLALTKYIPAVKSITNQVIETPELSKLKIINITQVDLDVTENDHSLNLEVNIKGLTKNEVSEILKRIKQRDRIIKVGDKIIDLNNDVFVALRELYFLLVSNKEPIDVEIPLEYSKIFLLDNLVDSYKNISFNFSNNVIKRLEKIKSFEVKNYTPKDLINCDLRDYQVDGINYILSLMDLNYGAILADEMGLGKTIQALSVANYFIKQNKKILVTAPTSLLYNWKNEIEKFLSPDLNVILMEGNLKNRRKLFAKLEEANIILTSYNLLKRDIDWYEHYDFDLFILDEAQFIKNFNTQNNSSITKVNAKHKLALTGTPIENGVKDLYSIMMFIIPGFFGNYRNFYRFFEQPIVVYNDDTKLRLLKQIVAPFIIRRLKVDVLDSLPEKKETIVYNEMNDKQRKLYQDYIQEYQTQINNNPSLSKVELLSMIMRLRQIAIDPRLIEPDYPQGEKLNSIIHEIITCIKNGEKVLVFSQFVKMLDIIAIELDNININYYTLTGKTPKEQRQKLVNHYNSNDDVNVFLISLKAGGTGLNLTSANNVIITDPWWNKSVENQAADRVHRIGQTQDVEIKRFITKETIESRIMEVQTGKMQLSQNLLTNDITSVDSLDIEELKDLLF